LVTHAKKLKTGSPLWQHLPAPRVPYAALHKDARTDVLIVGGGITGAMAGEALAEAGLETIIVDRRQPTTGSTLASTALVSHEIDTPLSELTEKIGHRNAIRAWRRSRLTASALSAFFRERGILAERRDALYLAGNRLNAEALRREAALRQTAGIDTRFLSRGALRERFGISRSAALLSFDNLAINPRAAAARLLLRAKACGARLHAPVDIVDIAHTRSSVVATSRDGPKIRCRSLVLATGYEFPKIVPMKGHRISATWAFATAPQPRRLWPEQCLIWEAAAPYLYVRTTADGRVICGGEDEAMPDEASRREAMPRKIARLRRKLGKLFPEIDTQPEFSWAGSFGETTTGLPTIGRVPRQRNCWVALGYGGNGTTFSRIAAEVLRSGLTGDRDPDADLYAFKP
jgi:glycine/D-amino acid oxidase-like deaminating enzyme